MTFKAQASAPKSYASVAAAMREMERLLYPSVELVQSFNDLTLTEKIVAPVKPKWLLEIGAFKGGTTLLWAWLCPPGTIIISVDIEPQYDAGLLMALARSKGQALHLIKGDSLAAETQRAVADILAGEMLDVLYIDSLHEDAQLAGELYHYAPLMRSGGRLGLHDITAPMMAGTVNAFAECGWLGRVVESGCTGWLAFGENERDIIRTFGDKA